MGDSHYKSNLKAKTGDETISGFASVTAAACTATVIVAGTSVTTPAITGTTSLTAPAVVGSTSVTSPLIVASSYITVGTDKYIFSPLRSSYSPS